MDDGSARPEFLLFVSAGTPRSFQAERQLRRVLTRVLGNAFHLEVHDVTANPDLVDRHRVIATPTIIRLSPNPQVRLIGSAENMLELASALGLSGDMPLD
jgi:circadian clock protein KaiB